MATSTRVTPDDSSTPSTSSTPPAATGRRGSIRATAPLMQWRTVDILTIAFLGAAIGIAFWAWGIFYVGPLSAIKFGFPPLAGLFVGPWFLAGVVGGLVVRRPGAAFMCEMVAALVSMIPGTEWGVGVIYSGLVQGLGAELAFALLGYRAFGLVAAVLAGAASGLGAAIYESIAIFPQWSLGWKFVYAAVLAFSGAVIAGLGGWALTKALARRVRCGPSPQARSVVKPALSEEALSEGTQSEGTADPREDRLPGGAATPAAAGRHAERSVAGGPIAQDERPATGEVVLDALTWRPFGRREPVLRDISLHLQPGERVLLVGPSGSGKSTLLRAIGGLLHTADAGELTGTVTIDGGAPGGRAGDVGLVLQEPGAGVVAATVGRDVAFGLENVGMPPAEMPAAVTEALSSVGLADQISWDTPTSALSGGQTQRLALAGARTLHPSVLLLDEASAMLDPDHVTQVRDSVAGAVAAYPMTTVIVEHILGPWVSLVDRMLVLDDSGRLVADGPVTTVLERERARLLDMGVWVPGAPDPAPAISAELSEVLTGPVVPQEVSATSLTVTRTVRFADGTTTSHLAAATDDPLSPKAGTSTALVGPSGAGKSTVLAALSGALTPTSGSVTAGDQPVASLDSPHLAERIGWVPQWSSATIIAPTVLDEVLATSRALGQATPERERDARNLLAALGLGALAEADPRELSGGEQRRLALAAAVLHQPPLLLLDEPTVGQDRHTWAAIVGALKTYREAGGAAVVSTHDAALINRANSVTTLHAPGAGSDAETAGPERARPLPLAAAANPLALFAAAMLAVPAAVVPDQPRVSAAVFAITLLLSLVALWIPRRAGEAPRDGQRVRRFGGPGGLGGFALRLVPGVLGAVSVGWSTWLLGTHDPTAALTAAIRVLIIVTPSAALIPLVNPDRLGDYLGARLRLPARPVVALSAALQRIHTFGQVWEQIAFARRVRGVGVRLGIAHPVATVRYLASVTFGLLVQTLTLAADLAVAMDARGFATAFRRTWCVPTPWLRIDWVVLGAGVLPLLVALTL